MCEPNELIKDFSHLVANEVEVETENPAIRAPEIVKISAPFFESSDYLNGALNMDSGYCWNQTFTDIGNDFMHSFKLKIWPFLMDLLFDRDSCSNTGSYQIETIESEYHANIDFGFRSY